MTTRTNGYVSLRPQARLGRQDESAKLGLVVVLAVMAGVAATMSGDGEFVVAGLALLFLATLALVGLVEEMVA